MRLDDMPPKMRAAAVKALAKQTLTPIAPTPPGARPSKAEKPSRRMRWACRSCGEIFTAYRPAERHVDVEHGAGQISVEFEGVDDERKAAAPSAGSDAGATRATARAGPGTEGRATRDTAAGHSRGTSCG